MSTKKQRIRVEEFLRRFNAGERNFIDCYISDPHDGLLRGIDLSGINLEQSYISIDLSGANLRKANLRNTLWSSGFWEDVDFSESDMTGVSNQDSFIFSRCNFSGAIWTEVDFFQCCFRDCELPFIDFDNVRLTETDLYG